MKRVLCVWLANWPLQRLLSARPELKGQAVVLHDGGGGSGAVVAACSPEAARRGVRLGMPVAEATACFGGSGRGAGGLVLEPHDGSADQVALKQLAGWCQRFSPVVGVEQNQEGCDTLLLDVTGCERLFGSEEALAERVVREFARRGFVVRVAMADTIGAAWAVARYGGPTSSPWKVVAEGKVAQALGGLPIQALRLPGEVVEWLAALGIQGIEHLDRLPRRELAARFGPPVLERLDQALGRLAEVMVPSRPPSLVEARWSSWEYAIGRREALELAIQGLVEQMTGELFRRGQGVCELECGLGSEAGETVTFSLGLFRASSSVRHLMELVRLRLDRVSLRDRVSAIRVRATATAGLESRQPELFECGSGRERDSQLAALIDRLGSRLGREAVVRARLLSDAQPEYAWRYEPLLRESNRATGCGNGRRSKTGGSVILRDAPRAPSSRLGEPLVHLAVPPIGLERPLRLCASPVPVSVVSVVPEGPPIWCWLRGRRRGIRRSWGPERIKTGWWRGVGVARDYYRVETDQGHRLWLFRSVSEGRWYLHGWFE